MSTEHDKQNARLSALHELIAMARGDLSCDHCDGTGDISIERHWHDDDDDDFIVCPWCDGTGEQQNR